MSSTPIRSSGTKWSWMQNKSCLLACRHSACVRTRQRELRHSPVLIPRIGNRRGGEQTWMRAGLSRWSSSSQDCSGTTGIQGGTRVCARAGRQYRRCRRRDDIVEPACALVPASPTPLMSPTPLVKSCSAPVLSGSIRSLRTKRSRSWNKAGRRMARPRHLASRGSARHERARELLTKAFAEADNPIRLG
ncbi:hypothetical protein PMI42_00666 [Bradyrhizobium sp. YR681]|nr:hypothetical protein PMI42_00666 [Bradyrhizobium sp. YR681]